MITSQDYIELTYPMLKFLGVVSDQDEDTPTKNALNDSAIISFGFIGSS